MRSPIALVIQAGILIGLFVGAVAIAAVAVDLIFPREVTVSGFLQPVQEGTYSWRGRPYASSPAVRMTISFPSLPEDQRLTSVDVKLENNLPNRVIGTVTIIVYERGFIVIAQGTVNVELASKETKSITVTLSWSEGRNNQNIWGLEAEFNGAGRRFF